MKTPFIFLKNKQPWQWTSCKHPKTLSFRASPTNADHVFKTVNSVFLDTSDALTTHHSHRATAAAATFSDHDNSETVVHNLHLSDTERLFFDPGYTSSSIVKGETTFDHDKKREATVVVMESDDPYSDFKKSMAEMVENQGLMKNWDCLEELLGWYLRMNSNNNHSFIVAAFLDLLLTSSSPSSSSAVCRSDSSSYSSAKSCFSSPPSE